MVFSNYQNEVIRNLETDGENYITGLLAEDAEENLQLEFKTKKEPNKLKLHIDDKQNLGKALSGFSNAEGGIVIWGIATKKENGIDKADKPRPIADIDHAFEVFRNQCATSLQPENQAIKFLRIKCSDDTFKGYIAIAVPKGQVRPYMSKAPDHSKYFRRTSIGFQPLEHYEIADLFLSNTNAVLELGWDVSLASQSHEAVSFTFELFVRNIGAVPATEPYFILNNSELKLPLSGYGVKEIKGTNNVIFKASTLEQVFPEETYVLLRLPIHLELASLQSVYWGQYYSPTTPKERQFVDVDLVGKVGCLNGTVSSVEIPLSASDVGERCSQVLRSQST